MRQAVVPSQYLQIALDLATRIAQGELTEGSRIYGRSVLASEYGVSPETIRKALRLLADKRPAGVVHCFSGSVEMMREVVRLGMYVGLGGVVTFKNARRAPDILRWLPLDRLMLETDAPYMAPEPFRGKRCDSTMIARSAETVAQLRGLTRDEVEAVTLENGKKFFGIA